MHLLLIEDDLELGAELQRALKGHGVTSEWVRSAMHARAMTSEQQDCHFACAVLDLSLPDGEGLDLLRRWRRDQRQLPVIILTARDALDSRVAGLDAGADDYVIKPVAPVELVSRIRAVTRRAAGQASSLWEVGRLSIHTGKCEVRLDGVVIAFSPLEFQLLTLLAENAGEVVPKQRLARVLLPLSESREFSAIEWHIHNLRRKLGEEMIRTVRGVGYSLEEA